MSSSVKEGAASCGVGDTGKEGVTELSPDLLLKLKREYILPVQDVPLKLKKAWKMTKNERQQGLACVVCGRPLSSLKLARLHVKNKSHQLKQKCESAFSGHGEGIFSQDRQLQEYLPTLSKLSPAHLRTLTSFLTDTFHQHSARSQWNERHMIAEQLETCLKEDGLDVTVSLFGSSASGFALASSNVNLNVCTSGASENQELIAECMKSVAVSLKKRGEVYWNVQEDYFAFNKIPRILFQHQHSKLRCEVRIEAGNPAALCSLLKLYAEIDERCVQLATLFRLWAKVCCVDNQEKGHYPGHMFVVMVIHFLQQTGVLPILHELYKKKSTSHASTSKLKNCSADTLVADRGSDKEQKGCIAWDGERDGKEVYEGSEGEDDIIFVDDCEEELEESRDEGNGERKVGKEEESRKMYDIDYFSDLCELPKLWQCTNTETLGELWCHLLKYYTVDFKVDLYAVTIRQKAVLLRQTRQWGDSRLAAEDPLIPKSNLGRAASSQQVYDYLMSSLRLSALYFSGYRGQMPLATLDDAPVSDTSQATQSTDLSSSSQQYTISDRKEEEGGKEKGNIEHQDSSILFASAPSKKVSRVALNTPVDLGFIGQGSAELSDELSIDAQTEKPESTPEETIGTLVHKTMQALTIQKEKKLSSPSSSPPPLSPSVPPPPLVHEVTFQDDEIDSQNQESLTRDGTPSSPPFSPPPPPSHSVSPAVNVGTSLKVVGESSPDFTFTCDNFVFQSYPVSCLNCKKLKHSILECPELDLVADYVKQLPERLPKPAVLKQIHRCFTDNMKRELLDENHLRMRRDILASILEDIHVLYPYAQLEMFGSSANGFGSKDSDLDICLTLPGHDKNARGKIIELIAAVLAKHRWKYDQIVPITSARVPIVKFYMKQWKMQCDISLENKLALRNTKLLAAYTKIDSRVPELGCALKRLAKSCDICDAAAGSLSSYAYILMLLHYLQTVTPPVIPNLQQLKSAGTTAQEHIIDDWECYYYEFRSIAELKKAWSDYGANKSSSGQLWLGLLKYYTTEFDWNQNVVTIKQCTPLSKFDKWWMGKCMCIEDPFNLDHNLGGGITHRMRAYILDRFMSALQYHSEDGTWNSIRQLMDPVALKGETRPPKFMRCHNCGNRGHRAAECPNKGNQLQQVAKRNTQQRGTQEQGNIRSNPQERSSRAQERLVYNVVPSPGKPKSEKRQPSKQQQHPDQMMPAQFYPLMPAARPPSTRPILPTSTMHYRSPPTPTSTITSPTAIFPYPPYPLGLHGYPTNVAQGGMPMPAAVNVPYGHSYPMQHYAGNYIRPQLATHGRMVTPQHQTHYHNERMDTTQTWGRVVTPQTGTQLLPHTVSKSPPYRQYQQPARPVVLLQRPTVANICTSTGSPQAYIHNLPTQVPSQPVYSRPSQSFSTQRQTGKINKQTPQGDNL